MGAKAFISEKPLLSASLSLMLIIAQAARAGSGDWAERKEWLVLEGTVGPNRKAIKAVGEAQLKILRAAREEVKLHMHDTRVASMVPFVHDPFLPWFGPWS